MWELCVVRCEGVWSDRGMCVGGQGVSVFSRVDAVMRKWMDGECSLVWEKFVYCETKTTVMYTLARTSPSGSGG